MKCRLNWCTMEAEQSYCSKEHLDIDRHTYAGESKEDYEKRADYWKKYRKQLKRVLNKINAT